MTRFLFLAALAFPSCAGHVLEWESSAVSATLGRDENGDINSSMAIYDLSDEGGWYVQFPLYTALAIVLDETDEGYYLGGNVSQGSPYEHVLPMNVSAGRTYKLGPTAWWYLGAGLGFTHIAGARDTSIPGIVSEYSSTRDGRLNINTGIGWQIYEPVGLQLNYDSAFNVFSASILLFDVF